MSNFQLKVCNFGAIRTENRVYAHCLICGATIAEGTRQEPPDDEAELHAARRIASHHCFQWHEWNSTAW